MDVNWLYENVETERAVAAKPVQITVETEAALPGGLREEAKVFYTDALAAVNGGEMAGGRVTADGRVTFHVLYAQGDMNRVRALEAAADFSQSLALPGGDALAAAAVRPWAEVANVTAKAFNGRLLLRANVNLGAEAAVTRTVLCLKDAEETDGLEKDMQALSLERTVGEGQGQTLLREEFALSDVLQITDTLYASARAQAEDISGGADGRATVHGTIQIEAWHASDMPGRPLVNTRHTMPYEQVIGLSGALGDALTARSQVRDVAVLSQENEDGSRTLRAEVQLYSEMNAVETGETALLRDAFTTQGEGVELTAEEIQFRTGTINEQAEGECRTVMLLPEGAPRVKTALAGFARPLPVRWTGGAGSLTAEGVLALTLVYADEEGHLQSAQQETPFRTVFATAAAPEDRLSVAAGEVELSAQTGDRVEFRCALHLTAEGVRQDQAAVITSAQAAPVQEMSRGISLHFLQPGETVWEIAKQCRVPLNGIRALNPQLPDAPAAGTPVITYRK